jgi:type I restriction enzyme M protein
MGTQGENGQFRTPRHIIDWIVACLDPQPTDRILDPACGTGGFLVSAYRHILQKHTSPGSKLPGDRLGHEQRQRLYANFTGYDITDLMVKLSKVNLFLHQFPSPAIHIYDSLSNDARWSEKADLILANPPFMTPKGGVTPHTKFRVPAKKAEVLFTDYIAEHLTPDGRAGIIVPNGIVATTQNAYVSLRRFLVEDSLVAVVSLPAGVFKPYSGVKTSILLLDKKLARRTDKILFLKIAADGFDLGDQRREITANDLPEAERVVKAWFKGKLADDFVSQVAWKLVEKRELMAHRSVGLQAEPFLGGPVVEREVEVARLADIVEINPKKSEVRALPPETPVSFVPMDELSTDRPSFTGVRDRPISEVLTGYTYFRDGDVLLAKITPCFENGKAGIARNLRNGIGFGSSEFYVFRCGEKVIPEYLYYLITQPTFREEGEKNMSGTGGQQRVTREFLENHEIPLPPLEEQRRIVAEIEGYQQVIDGARQILAAHQPTAFAELEATVAALGSVCTIHNGFAFKSEEYVEEPDGLRIIRISNVQRGQIVDDRPKFYAKTRAREFERYAINKDDLLMLLTGNVGRVGIMPKAMLPALLNQRVAKLVPDTERIDPRFLFHVLNDNGFEAAASANATGAAQQNLSTRWLESYEIPLPPLPEQRQIVAELDAEAAEVAAVRALIPRTEAKIQRVLARVWGTGAAS